MTTTYPPATAPSAAFGGRPNILRRTEAWLDRKGRKAWIAAMILGFIAFWPIGLALVAYITYTNRWSADPMTGQGPRRARCHARQDNGFAAFRVAQPSGNAAFDSYKSEMLKRLEDEQTAFEAFLQRLRDAKDKSEFDAFMADRAKEARLRDTETRDDDKPAMDSAARLTDPAPRSGEY